MIFPRCSRSSAAGSTFIIVALACTRPGTEVVGSSDDTSTGTVTSGETTSGETTGEPGPCTEHVGVLDGAGGVVEYCGVTVGASAGLLAQPATVTIAVPDLLAALPLPLDRELVGFAYDIAVAPPLPLDVHLDLFMEHDADPRVRGLARAEAEAWTKVAVAAEPTNRFHARVSSFGTFSALRDTRAMPTNDPTGIGTVKQLEADYMGRTLTCRADDRSYAYAVANADGDWAVTTTCEHFADNGETFVLRVDLSLGSDLMGDELAQASIYTDDGSWGYVFLADWMPPPTVFDSVVDDGELVGYADVRVWMGPDNGRDLRVRWRVASEGFAYMDR